MNELESWKDSPSFEIGRNETNSGDRSHPEVEGHSALITLTFSGGKWTVARGNNLGRMELS